MKTFIILENRIDTSNFGQLKARKIVKVFTDEQAAHEKLHELQQQADEGPQVEYEQIEYVLEPHEVEQANVTIDFREYRGKGQQLIDKLNTYQPGQMIVATDWLGNINPPRTMQGMRRDLQFMHALNLL